MQRYNRMPDIPKKATIDLSFYRKILPLSALVSGIILLALLPIGMFQGIHTPSFRDVFVAHISVQALSVLASIFLLLYLSWRSMWSVFALLPVVFFIAVIVCLGLLPVLNRDALIHHLAVPRWWLQSGRIHEITWHDWSYYPMLIELGFTAILSNIGEVGVSLYHASYLLILCGIVSVFCYDKTKSVDVSVFAYLLTLSLPICINLASSPQVDLGLALYSSIAIFLAAYWVKGPPTGIHAIGIGVALGLAMGTKYNGLLMLLVFIMSFIIYGIQSGLAPRTVFWRVIGVCCVAFLTYFPWMVKNFIWTNNPFYPLFNGFFGVVNDYAGVVKGLKPLEHRMIVYGETWQDLITLPVRMLFFGADDDPRAFDGVLSPVLILALFPVLKLKNRHWIAFLYIFIVLYFGFAILLAQARIRYLSPLFGPMIVLSAVGLTVVGAFLDGRLKKLIYNLFIFLHVICAGYYSLMLLSRSQAIEYFLGAESKEEYLRRKLDEYPMIDYINRNVDDSYGYIYLLYTGNRFYYYDKKVLSGGHYSGRRIVTWLRNSPNADFFSNELRTREIGYILAHTKRTIDGLKELFSPEEQSTWTQFSAKHLKLVYTQGAYSLWKII